MYSGVCRRELKACFVYDQMDHFKRDYPQLLGGSSQGSMQLVVLSASFSTPSQGAKYGVAGRGICDRNTGGKGAG